MKTKIKNVNHKRFELTAIAVAFVLLAGVIWPATYTFADDSSSTPTDTSTDTSTVTPDATTPDTGDASVTTGDASSESDAQNQVNANTVSTAPDTTDASATPTDDSDTTGADTDDSGSTTPDVSSTTPDTDPAITTDEVPLLVTSDNAATTTNTTSASADTGGNSASSTQGTASIATGDAFASANVLNVINTNIVNSNGLLLFGNVFSSLGINLDNLDLSYFTNPSATTNCSIASCVGGNVTVSSTNTATTTNTVSVMANTGSNSVSSTDGVVTVTSGNAYASGNAVNLINSNIVNSNYLLVGINDFGDLAGDLTLPGASFFEQLLSQGSNTSNVSVTTNNVASVTDSTSATADTGENSATSSSGDASVTTGTALSSATTLNQVNTSQVGGTNVYFLFRIFGSLKGSVQGLPAGLQWQQTPDGLVITNSSGGPATLPADTSTTVSTTNSASLANNVSVYALTGSNEASGGTASVSTGNAEAAANSVNIVNTNLVGTNWIYAIFNIFGNVDGNIAFGEPDLWIGAEADASNPTMPDTDVPFTFTVTNRGDADATNVELSLNFLSGMLTFDEGSSTSSTDSFNLGTIAAGQSEQFTYDAETGDVNPGYSVDVPLTATVTSDQPDSDPSDNTDNLTLVVANPSDYDGDGGGGSTVIGPRLHITKTADTVATTSPATVNYKIAMTNSGGPAYHAIATDTLTDPSGNVVNQQSWNLDTINTGDEVDITYSTVFASTSVPGVYTNVVTVDGQMGSDDPNDSVAFPEASASTTVTILAPTPGVCSPYLTSYLRLGGDNDSEQVTKLQEFLQKTEGDSSVSVTGIFDSATDAAVKAFQAKYEGDILAPWGYNKPTGYVYYTTQNEINNIWCDGQRSFSLSESQLQEISTTKSIIADFIQKSAHLHDHASASSTPPLPALPVGIQVGIVPAPPIPTKHSWFPDFVGAQQSFMANVLNAFSSLKNVVAIQ